MKSKRYKIAVGVLTINFVLFGIGMFKDMDLTALGSGLALLNVPLYTYIFGETKRKSDV